LGVKILDGLSRSYIGSLAFSDMVSAEIPQPTYRYR
jgi:hypothetical protein